MASAADQIYKGYVPGLNKQDAIYDPFKLTEWKSWSGGTRPKEYDDKSKQITVSYDDFGVAHPVYATKTGSYVSTKADDLGLFSWVMEKNPFTGALENPRIVPTDAEWKYKGTEMGAANGMSGGDSMVDYDASLMKYPTGYWDAGKYQLGWDAIEGAYSPPVWREAQEVEDPSNMQGAGTKILPAGWYDPVRQELISTDKSSPPSPFRDKLNPLKNMQYRADPIEKDSFFSDLLEGAAFVGGGMLGLNMLFPAISAAMPGATAAAVAEAAAEVSAAGVPVFDAGAGAWLDSATGGIMANDAAMQAIGQAITDGALSVETASSMLTNYGNSTGLLSQIPAGGSVFDLLSNTPSIPTGSGSGSGVGTVAGSGSTGSITNGLLGATSSGGFDWAKIASGGIGLLGNYLQGDQAQGAQQDYAKSLENISKMNQFRPVGVTTRFGSSNFTTDPTTGQVTNAGYTLTPDVKAIQDRQMGMLPGLQKQYEDVTALGKGYLATSPQEQAAKYMAEQQALLEPYRARELSSLENRLAQQGRLGLATGATGMMGAANPELEAFANAKRMQDLQLAAQSTQGGMDYAKFGLGIQSQGYQPLQTALGAAGYLEGLGQQPMDMGINIGAKGQAANQGSMNLLAQSAQAMKPANSYDPWGSALSGAAGLLSQYGQQPQQQQAPYQPSNVGYVGGLQQTPTMQQSLLDQFGNMFSAWR